MIRNSTIVAGILGWVLISSGRAQLGWEECLQTALDKSPRLAQARADIPGQEGVALASHSALLPSLNMTAVAIPPVASFNLRQSIFNLSAVDLAKSGNARLAASRANYELEVWRLVEELRAAYLQVEFRQKLLALRVIYAEELNLSLNSTRDLLKAGQARAVDVRRIEVNVGLARIEINEARVDLEQSWLDLTELTGLPMREMQDTKDTPRVRSVFSPVIPLNMEEKEWLAAALAFRPDLRALEAMKTVGSWQLVAIKHQGFPVVSAVADTRLAPDTGDWLGSLSISRDEDNKTIESNFFFGANFNWKIWDGGERRGRAESSEAKLEVLEVGIRRLRELTIPGQVRKALESLRAAKDIYQAVENPERDRIYRKDAAQLSEAGRITKLEDLEVARDRLRLQQTSLQALYRVELARLGLQAASGQHIQYRDIPMAVSP